MSDVLDVLILSGLLTRDHDRAVGFGDETDAALLKFVHDDGKGIGWFHGSAAQEDD